MARLQSRTLRSLDPSEPLDIVRIDRDGPGDIDILTGRLAGYSANAPIAEVYEKLVFSPAKARWVRDTLNQMDLTDDD